MHQSLSAFSQFLKGISQLGDVPVNLGNVNLSVQTIWKDQKRWNSCLSSLVWESDTISLHQPRAAFKDVLLNCSYIVTILFLV